MRGFCDAHLWAAFDVVSCIEYSDFSARPYSIVTFVCRSFVAIKGTMIKLLAGNSKIAACGIFFIISIIVTQIIHREKMIYRS